MSARPQCPFCGCFLRFAKPGDLYVSCRRCHADFLASDHMPAAPVDRSQCRHGVERCRCEECSVLPEPDDARSMIAGRFPLHAVRAILHASHFRTLLGERVYIATLGNGNVIAWAA